MRVATALAFASALFIIPAVAPAPARALSIDPGVDSSASSSLVETAHHRSWHRGGRGHHYGWYKPNRGHHYGWRKHHRRHHGHRERW